MTSSDKRPVAWVTGGGTGIGLSTARALAVRGWHVVVSGRRKPELEAAVAAIAAAGDSAEAMPADVSDASAVGAVADAIVARHGRIDALVCAAGTNVPNRFWDALKPEDFAKVSAINLNGVAFCVSAVLPAMRKAGGSIVVVSSWAGWRYLSFTGAAYMATKQGLAPLVESINDQEGGNGIRATHVCPGEVATPILRSRPKPPPEEDMARMLKPEDVAEAIVYAISAPPHVCLNEIVISPTWNRIYRGADDLRRG
ncbi:MAG: SDR family oxidoreductase [Limnobacter sp.]|nr:SDR family oxidoreductase [Limnobacter sp.]